MGSDVTGAVTVADGFWDTYSTYYDSVYRLMPYRKLLWDVFEALELKARMRILDAGCGTGNLEHFIAEKSHPTVEIDAVDFSPAMLARARAKCADLEYVRFAETDLDGRLPFEDATFDRIVSINVLYALKDQVASVRELLRVLKPGGKLVLASPKPEFRWRPLAAEHFRRIGNIWGASRKAKAVLSGAVTMSTTAAGSFVLNTLVINRRERRGDYHSMGQPELKAFFEQRRADGVGDFSIEPTMADQSLLATASKASAA